MSAMSTIAVNRRNFVAGAAACAAVAAGMGASSQALALSQPDAWDMEADVVIVGFGGAGGCAAVAASEAGASVILLEKANESDAGGNTSCCTGGTLFANPAELEEAYHFIKEQTTYSTVSDDEIRAFVKHSSESLDWMEAHGWEGNINRDMEQGGTAHAHSQWSHSYNYDANCGGGGAGIIAWLRGLIGPDENITVCYETPAQHLVFDPDTKEVFGVKATDKDGNLLMVKARRGVILTCGGFENSTEMMSTYFYPNAPVYPAGTPFNTGDGIKMAAEVGARMRGMSAIEWCTHCCKPASDEIGVSCGMPYIGLGHWQNSIMVNADGNRFVDEAAPNVKGGNDIARRPMHSKEFLAEFIYEPAKLTYANLPMFYICSEERIGAGPLFSAVAEGSTNHYGHLHGWYTWSDDNQAEIEKGWIVKADTIEELAEKLGINPEGLAATVARYNAACEAGTDDEFGRYNDFTPVLTGPFYGCELGLGIINTQGGPARNGDGQVVDYDDNPIPRLYSGGELGSIYTWLYQGGGSTSECYCARVAGENAAMLEPWC